MLAIPLDLILLSMTIWGFFKTALAGWFFLGAITLFLGWLLLVCWSMKSNWVRGLDANAFSHMEEAAFRKHAFYFLMPFQAKEYSSVCSFAQLMCCVWFGLFVWNGLWTMAVVTAVVFMVASQMAMLMNIGNFLRIINQQGKLTPELCAKLEVIETVESKILKARGLI